jgi:CHAT domain-containing protein
LARGDPELSRLAFEALAENRAATIREQLAVYLARSSLLPPEYFKLLSQLQILQSRFTLGQGSGEDEEKLADIRLQLSDFENKIGLESQNSAAKGEKNALRNSLKHIQDRLGDSDLLLSYCLGGERSFLWAVTAHHVNLYELPNNADILRQTLAFSAGVREGRATGALGKGLAQALFGKLPAASRQKRNWLITPDGALLDSVPLAALPEPGEPGADQALIANHTVRTLPSELLLLTPRSAAPQPQFVGVGDPVYNSADSRRLHGAALLETNTPRNSVSLARLAGSAKEIRTAAQLSGLPHSTLLLGTDANSSALRNALAHVPELLHFAVHVVSPPGRPEDAALALSLSSDNMPELLTRESIAAYRVPGTLVVVSGCASDQGRKIPGAGVIGLGRAWLLAGASAVVVSAWPTPDDSGRFFSAFYSHLQILKSGPLAERAATALQQAQLEMRQGGGYRSSPSFWAAYSILSKE